jgi:hypothetical protein
LILRNVSEVGWRERGAKILYKVRTPSFSERMKRVIAAILFAGLVLSARAASIEGEIKLNYSESMFSDDVFKREFGDTVKVSCHWHAGEFFGQETVFAGVNVKNTGAKPMFFHYYVAFFDKNKKLVGSTGQGSFGDKGLEPGKEEQMGSCMIYLPKDKYKEIVSYQAVIYETDVPPKKK